MTKMTQNVNVNLAFVFVSSNGKICYFSQAGMNMILCNQVREELANSQFYATVNI